MDTSILSMSIEDSYEVVGDYPYEDAEVTIAYVHKIRSSPNAVY